MSGLRDALAGLSAPEATTPELPRVLSACDGAAEDFRIALDAAARQNDPDGLPPIAVEAVVSLQGLEAAAKAAEAHYAGLRKAAKAGADALRAALGAGMADGTIPKRVEASAHAATPEAGSFGVVLVDPDALPLGMLRTTVKPDLYAIGKALAAGEAVPGARRERGPAGVRIVKLKNPAF